MRRLLYGSYQFCAHVSPAPSQNAQKMHGHTAKWGLTHKHTHNCKIIGVVILKFAKHQALFSALPRTVVNAHGTTMPQFCGVNTSSLFPKIFSSGHRLHGGDGCTPMQCGPHWRTQSGTCNTHHPVPSFVPIGLRILLSSHRRGHHHSDQLVGGGQGLALIFIPAGGGGGPPPGPPPPLPSQLKCTRKPGFWEHFLVMGKKRSAPSAHAVHCVHIAPCVLHIPCFQTTIPQRSLSVYFSSPVPPLPHAKCEDVIDTLLYFRFKDRITGHKRHKAYNEAQKACATIF